MKSILSRYQAKGLRPKKSFGQNFLHDVAICARIADACPAEASVLEIGPGLGALTEHLLRQPRPYRAIEKDRELRPLLVEYLEELERAEQASGIVLADAAEVDWLEILAPLPKPWALVGNLPYAVTGQLLRKAIAAAPEVECAVFMIQKEVADRLVAKPGTSAYGALSVFAQAAFACERIMVVKGGAFFPPPKVDSAVVRLTPHPAPRAEESPLFQEVVRRAFAMRRKTLRNGWKGMFGWTKAELEQAAGHCQIRLSDRGERLAVEDFGRLALYRKAELERKEEHDK